ncbi:DNA alkylation repair protein [Streptomyces coffeae]|uniref:DNA alkylation repair protein n=1 Tax=Streptomyces coffeae TaxID=621382 RepID=A0ABS1NKX5_9ACTN|nr:DNA alkylation repair protein [Streptomyces coffeae]MBL1100674.1 DNA alkylation repair protein [Streptomyces coffeae]
MPTADELLGAEVVADLAARMAAVDPGRPLTAVTRTVNALDGLGLRQRSDLVRDALLTDLPGDYPELAKRVRAALGDVGFTGWLIWPVSEAVAVRALQTLEAGVAHPAHPGDVFEDALRLLAALTPRLTCEYAIRRLLNADPDRAMAVIREWTAHPDEHVRRLASEGTRPRLPWAVRVPALFARPEATLPLLDALYRDPSEYVRRSVANHLNDISHDRPELAVETATAWAAAPDAETPRVIRHALRTVVKRGDPRALALLGFEPVSTLAVSGPTVAEPVVRVGGELRFGFTLENTGSTPLRLAIDYIVHYRKANGTTAPKVYKLTTMTLEPGETETLSRARSFKPISTRVFHPGEHTLELQINGEPRGSAPFGLVVPADER